MRRSAIDVNAKASDKRDRSPQLSQNLHRSIASNGLGSRHPASENVHGFRRRISASVAEWSTVDSGVNQSFLSQLPGHCSSILKTPMPLRTPVRVGDILWRNNSTGQVDLSLVNGIVIDRRQPGNHGVEAGAAVASNDRLDVLSIVALVLSANWRRRACAVAGRSNKGLHRGH